MRWYTQSTDRYSNQPRILLLQNCLSNMTEKLRHLQLKKKKEHIASKPVLQDI